MILATPYYPNLNPVGAPSVFAAGIALAFWAFSKPLGTPVIMQRLVRACASPVLLAMAVLGTSSRGPNADELVAAIIYLVFGFAFALNCFALLHLGYRAIGWVFTLAHGSLLIMLVAPWLFVLYSSFERDDSQVVLGGLIVFVIAWTAVLLSIDRRARRRLREQRGCCTACSYSLTGNVSGVCPECGQPIAPAARPG